MCDDENELQRRLLVFGNIRSAELQAELPEEHQLRVHASGNLHVQLRNGTVPTSESATLRLP
jgi:hypothetical protein